MKETYPLWLAGEPVSANHDLEVTNKYDDAVASRVALASREHIDSAIAAAVEAFEQTRWLPSYRRKQACEHVARRLGERREELARILAIEAGKPIQYARGEVDRAIDTFTIAAEEAVRIGGEWMPLDISPRAAGYQGVWRRVPLGPCSFISPFNFPLNLVAHKVAPALAVGNTFVLKPASRTPVSALVLGEILAECDLPRGAFSILPCQRDGADLFTEDERLKLLSFTGSAEVGWSLKARAGKKKVILELGGNAGCIVHHDADIDDAVQRNLFGAFYQSGQSCISVQRIFVHERVYNEFRDRLAEAAERLPMGDPLDEKTFLGPLITSGDARRVEQWVHEAVAGGARLVCGGRREGNCYAATLLENVDPAQPVVCEEVFGPVAVLFPYKDFEQACAMVNDSRYGLQAGVFTRDLDAAFYAFNHLEVGGVVINDVPSMRVDCMPYGGVKDSGLGREGVRFTIEEATEIRLMVLRNVGVRAPR